jgi:hypothetical protein
MKGNLTLSGVLCGLEILFMMNEKKNRNVNKNRCNFVGQLKRHKAVHNQVLDETLQKKLVIKYLGLNN